MKKLINFSLFVFTAFIFNSCKPTDTKTIATTTGNVTVHFNNTINGNTIELGAAPSGTNSLNQKFSANILMYYISNLRIKDDKGNETDLKNYTLINQDPTALKTDIQFANLPNGNYTSITFNFGLDPVTNALQDGTGDLDHSKGMWWAQQKYLFLKHEGNFIDVNNATKGLLYHVGTDAAYVKNITIPVTGLSVNSNTKTVTVDFNLDKMYQSVNFENANNMMSDAKDLETLQALTANLLTAFTFNKVQ